MSKWIVVQRWDTFQHYKNREPPWIKNYTRLMRDDAYLSLPLSTRGVLHGVWLEYASSGQILSEAEAKSRLCRSDADAKQWRRHLERLNDAGFIRFRASKPLAKRYQLATPRVRDIKNRQEPVENPKKNGPDERKGSWCNHCKHRLPPGVSLEDHLRMTHGVNA